MSFTSRQPNSDSAIEGTSEQFSLLTKSKVRFKFFEIISGLSDVNVM